jgi:hypothetical protein
MFYYIDMNILPDLSPGKLILLAAPRATLKALIQEVVVRLAASGPVRMIIGNNQFDGYAIARMLRRHSPEMANLLERIQLARAFTCYQMSTLLRETPSAPIPTFVVGLLVTFYDENIPEYESLRVLRGCIWELNRLGRAAPLIASVEPLPQREALFHTIRDAADVTLMPTPEEGGVFTQLSLWDER